LLTNPPLVLDTDLVSSFAWIDRMDILETLFSEQMIILDEVLTELRRVEHLYAKVNICINNGSINSVSMLADSPAALELGEILSTGRYGTGEAACMAYLKYNSGTMGSNNLSDVKAFCEAKEKDLITTAMIIHYAVDTAVIKETEAATIWDSMLKKRRKLPADSYSAYVEYLRGMTS